MFILILKKKKDIELNTLCLFYLSLSMISALTTSKIKYKRAKITIKEID